MNLLTDYVNIVNMLDKSSELNDIEIKNIKNKIHELINIEKEKLNKKEEQKTYILNKKKKILSKKKLILEDLIKEYWIKEKKYKFPQELIDLNQDILNCKLINKNINVEIKSIEKKNKSLNLILLDQEKKIIYLDNLENQQTNKLFRLESNLKLSIQKNNMEMSNKKNICNLHLELLKEYLNLIQRRFIKENHNNAQKYNELHNKINIEIKNLKTKKLYCQKKKNNISALEFDSINLNLDLEKYKLEKIDIEYQNQKKELLECNNNNISENEVLRNNIGIKLKNIELTRVTRNNNLYQEIEELKNNNNKIEEDYLNSKKEKQDLKLQINKNLHRSIILQQESIHNQDKYQILISKLSYFSKKIAKKYLYYMNYYTYNIKDIKNDIYIVEKDILKISNYSDTNNLENYKINILKKLLHSIHIPKNNTSC